MRKRLKQLLPDHDAIRDNRWLRPFAGTLLHPRLWHLNRHSAAGAVAVGLFCGLIPGPLQMLGAAICCVVLRVNLPLALLCTLYTNPITIVPLYVVAFELGNWVMGNGTTHFTPPPEMAGMDLGGWVSGLIGWMAGLGKPLALGLVLLAAILSLAGYLGVKACWRWWLIRHWRSRRARHAAARNPANGA
ncbi:DUF2062 domain-containing protein [Thauera sinica]|uniref:DUF2062 domain-containing protein n=1 Tax=Thauera sinica TaxID=2665146 RepID=A0ABW1AQI0_9RHOO|nr:DUF2062 domain-containing protein [Thauera sp. K11]ATE62513.1 hypothetical protein CCZ27_06250 [Thauera sp. K11]